MRSAKCIARGSGGIGKGKGTGTRAGRRLPIYYSVFSPFRKRGKQVRDEDGRGHWGLEDVPELSRGRGPCSMFTRSVSTRHIHASTSHTLPPLSFTTAAAAATDTNTPPTTKNDTKATTTIIGHFSFIPLPFSAFHFPSVHSYSHLDNDQCFMSMK